MYVSIIPFLGDILIEASRIAIWERNKIIVVISTSFWVANVVLMIRSKPDTSSYYPRARAPYKTWRFIRCRTGEFTPSTTPLDLLSFIHLQLRAEWSAVLPGCIVFNSDSSKVNFITSLTHDIVLLLAILVRLLRFRGDGSGTFGLGLLLWKQV